MSRLLPEARPLVLHIASAAALQSGAPLGANAHFWWPDTTRVPGMRTTASAAPLAPLTVSPALSPNFSTSLPAPLKVEETWPACSENQRLTVSIKPPSDFGGAASCAAASEAENASAAASANARAKLCRLRALLGPIDISVLFMAGSAIDDAQIGIRAGCPPSSPALVAKM